MKPAALRHSAYITIVVLMLCIVTAQAQQGGTSSPLETCILSGDVACVQLQLEQGADVNQLTSFGATPLRVAIGHNFTDIALLLLAHHANPNLSGTDDFLKNIDKGASLLLIAVNERDVALTQALLEAGADPNAANLAEATPLLLVLTDVDPKTNTIFDLLLASKADPNHVDSSGDTPFSLAVGISLAIDYTDPVYKQRLKQMLAAGANPNLGGPKSSGFPIARVAEHGDKDLLALLLANGANPNLRDPLLLENIHARRDLAELLINNGLEVSLRNPDRATALNLAVERDDLPQAKLLLELGADPDVSHNGTRPLAAAGQKGNEELVRLLLDFGADPQVLLRTSQKQLASTDFTNSTILKLLNDRIALQNKALDLMDHYPKHEADEPKNTPDTSFAVADAKQIAEYAAAAPSDSVLLAFTIIFSAGSGMNPPLPAEALQHEQAGTAAYTAATSRTQFLSAANEFIQAAHAAPWMPAYPRNACLLLMMGGAYAPATPLCFAYKTINPSDTGFGNLILPYTQREAALLYP